VSKLFIFEKSFTLLEILLVIGIISILLVFIVPLSLDFYKSQQLEAQTQSVIQTLRRAQSKAMAMELDSPFGIYFGTSNYTLFKGSFYSDPGRDLQYDEIFDLPEIINVSGLNEIVFLKSEGVPDGVSAYCGGICTPCSNLNSSQCPQQQGCRWRGGRCRDNPGCTSCNSYQNQSDCESQLGCAWQPEIRGGNIILSVDNKTRTININEIGRVNLE